MSGVRVESSPSRIVHQLPYLNAPPRGGPPLRGLLDIEVLRASGIGQFAGLVVTGDLQFRAKRDLKSWEPGPMLGEVLAEELALLCDSGILPAASSLGVVLTGDLFCGEEVDRRGETGDVRSVWEAFAQRFMAVVGVAGNHDTFGDQREEKSFRSGAGRYLLDLDVVTVGGLSIGGLSGIVGDPGRRNRRVEDEYVVGVEVLTTAPGLDLLVLHESPGLSQHGLVGNERVAQLLGARHVPLVVCGHSHWGQHLAELPSGTQVLNVDARCVVLLPAG